MRHQHSTEAAEGMANAICYRIRNFPDLFKRALVLGPSVLLEVINSEAERHASAEEIGTSDVSCAVNAVIAEVERMKNAVIA